MVIRFNFRVVDDQYTPIVLGVLEKFRQDYIHGLQQQWASLFCYQWRDCWVEDALSYTMARYVQCFIISVINFYSTLFVFFYRGLDWIISRVDDEQCNDVGFKDALVMQDIQPIGALSRVVLGTLMKQPWVPYEYKCLLFCFATDPTEDEVHHAFCRFSCNRHINIFQM